MSHESRQPARFRTRAAMFLSGLALAGGEAPLLIDAGPAHAGTEAASTHEAQPPAQYLSEVLGKANTLAGKIVSAKGAVRDVDKNNGNVTYILLAPDRANPKVHDELSVVFNDKGQVSGFLLDEALDSKKGGKFVDPKLHDGYLVVITNVTGDVTNPPDTFTVSGHGRLSYVTTATAKQFKKIAINYATNPHGATQEIGDFFNRSQGVITRHYAHPLPVFKEMDQRAQEP